MLAVEEWLPEFLRRYRMRYRPFDWPEPGGEEELLFVEVWLRVLAEEKVSEAEADEASIVIGSAPPRYRSEHLAAILKAILAARTGRERSHYSTGHDQYPPGVSPENKVVLPEGVKDFQEYWRHLVFRMDERGKEAS